MKALVANAEWKPKRSYALSEDEKTQRRALVGSQVWCNPTFEIKRMPVPNIKQDEVLIRIMACGICGSDTHVYETEEDGYIIFSGLTKFPCILGHEFSGVVEKIGANVSTFKVGDKVAVESIMWCGMCEACRSGHPNQCRKLELMGLSADGALTTYIAVKERYCWNINTLTNLYPEDEVFEVGSLLEPVGCAYNGIFIAGGGFNPGAVVAIHGTGPIGLGAIAISRVAGASKIIAFDRINERVNMALQLGADYSFNVQNLNGSSPGEKVMELTGGAGADIQVETAGSASTTIPEMERSLAEQGKIIYLGRVAKFTPVHLDKCVSGATKIIGARGHSGSGVFPNLIRLLASGKLNLKMMITARFSADGVLDALESSVDRRNSKIIVRMND